MCIPRARQRSQVLVLFAITATALLAVVGLLFSFGLVLNQRRALQTAADAASLSATWQLLDLLGGLRLDSSADQAVLTRVVQFSTQNGVPSDGTTADRSYLSASYTDASGATLGSVGNGSIPAATRGVRVQVTTPVATVLPGFLRVQQLEVQTSAIAVARATDPPADAALVLPIAISVSDVRLGTSYDLFAPAHNLSSGLPPTLNLAGSNAPSYGPTATNMQYWSDGEHTTTWQLPQPSDVPLAGGAYFDSIATGLQDNVKRQGLADASGAAYALVTVPVFSGATASAVHVVGFVQLKILGSDISASSARGTFVLYPAGAGVSTASLSGADFGAALVQLIS